jgi:2-polyprenyl-3-methyl-5-hydroxy-6-metoxy-1,4-benzoquinol methylase
MTDAERTQALVGRLFEAGVGALDLLSVHIGKSLGYYEALRGAESGLNAAQLARKTGTHVRYAREWLEQQAATGLIEVDNASASEDKRRYILPPHAAEALLDENSLNYIAPLARLVVATTRRMPDLLKAYKNGGGVTWADYGPDMREAQAAFNRPMYLNLLAKEYLPSVKDVHAKLLKGRPARVADIACGGGWSSIAIAQSYPNAEVDGFDIDAPSVKLARKNAKDQGVSDRVKFHAVDAAEADLAGRYDLVMICEALHDMPRPVEVLKTTRKLAGAGGAVIIMDERTNESFEPATNPIERLLYGASITICLPDGMAHQPTAATGTVMRPATLRKYAKSAGFGEVEVLPIQNDFFRFYRLKQ